MSIRQGCRTLAISALVLCAALLYGRDIGLAEVKAIVKELDAVAPHHELYRYPIEVSLIDDEEPNAYVTVAKPIIDGKPKAKMVIHTGIIDFVKGDKRLLRAVIAHEMAHLSCGHLTPTVPAASDVDVLWSRQQEMEADIQGGSILQRAGYSKKDLCDLLMMFVGLEKSAPWLDNQLSDHPPAKMRAAEIAENPTVLKALVSFDTGLAYLECRRYQSAIRFFERAAAQEPKCWEASVNAAHASLLYYYDALPVKVRSAWLRPTFGTVLTETSLLEGRGEAIEEADRKRYREAMALLAKAEAAAPAGAASEVKALGLVLEPDGSAVALAAGIEIYKSLTGTATSPKAKVRYQNNIALALHRQGQTAEAYRALMLQLKPDASLFTGALAENLGRVASGADNDAERKMIAAVLQKWLMTTSDAHPQWMPTLDTWIATARAVNLPTPELEPGGFYVCRMVSLTVGGKELGLFQPVTDISERLGAADKTIALDPTYKDLTEMRWQGGDIAILTERSKVMRVTSRVQGSHFLLMPADRTMALTAKISVGMREKEFTEIFSLDRATEVELGHGLTTEKWHYFSSMNFGVLIRGGKIAGITCCPIQS